MAIKKSAKKALRQSQRRQKRNLRKKRSLKKLLKEVDALIGEKKLGEVKRLLPRVQKELDKAAKVGLIKKNTASRKKSRITKKIR